jgi:hypothetical protein
MAKPTPLSVKELQGLYEARKDRPNDMITRLAFQCLLYEAAAKPSVVEPAPAKKRASKKKAADAGDYEKQVEAVAVESRAEGDFPVDAEAG